MSATVTITTDQLREIVAAEVRAATEPLERQVHRLEATVRAKVAAPVHTLSVAEAAGLHGCCEKTIRRLLARGVFTDSRGGRRSGSEWRIFADEFELWRTDGAEAVKRFRQRNGRE